MNPLPVTLNKSKKKVPPKNLITGGKKLKTQRVTCGGSLSQDRIPIDAACSRAHQ